VFILVAAIVRPMLLIWSVKSLTTTQGVFPALTGANATQGGTQRALSSPA